MIVHIVLASIASLFVLAVAEIHRPTAARCLPGWSIAEGIRRSGEFACSPPLPAGCGEPFGPERPCPPLPLIQGKIWCGETREPIMIDHQAVACGVKRGRTRGPSARGHQSVPEGRDAERPGIENQPSIPSIRSIVGQGSGMALAGSPEACRS